MESKIAHLGFIQSVIERMARCSFLLRGWAVTLVSAIFALAAKDANTNYVIVAYISIVSFWVLDGYYLYQERIYRDLYVAVTKVENNNIDFSLDATGYSGKPFSKNSWTGGILSVTNRIFYGMLVVVLLLVSYFLVPSFAG